MLIEIRCDKFRSTSIVFHKGLNVVLGDDRATNSIGKSTLLMVIDFVMGGDSFIRYNKDVVDELGHHSYYFKLHLGGTIHAFRRGTHRPEVVFACTELYEEVESIDVNQYRAFLKVAYGLDSLDMTFRSVVSLFSRIWGKENLEPGRPLDLHKQQSGNDALNSILKLYDKYTPLQELAQELKEKQSDKNALSGALKKDFIPRIGKKKHEENRSLVTKITTELEDIKNNLARYATNIRELANREVAELKEAKDRLLQSKADVDSRLSRIRDSLRQTRHIRSRNFEALKTFFPNVYEEKIAQVEEFHSDIATILKNELKQSERELAGQQEYLETEIAKIDEKLSSILRNVENPGLVVDRVYDLSKSKQTAELENSYYEQDRQLTLSIKEVEKNLEQEKKKQLSLIEITINDKLQQLSSEIYGERKKSPYLTFGRSKYEFQIFEDTGTGKAYSNLILFDWAIFLTSPVPFLIHDSLLFKNIENDAVSKMIFLYSSSERQTFIAIDEIKKYGMNASAVLVQQSVIQLADDKVLYTKDWRK